jgi:putative component of membrane protein insertase Oxa1/YidC/SpoIIIJ protein YidD
MDFKKFIFIFLVPVFIFSKGYIEPFGKDSDIKISKKKEKIKTSFLTKAFDKIIIFHQKVLSPVDGPRSHFRPTSSRYMQLAMQRYGFFKGYIMGCDRLMRENKESWVYQTILIDNIEYKYDPASENKYIR